LTLDAPVNPAPVIVTAVPPAAIPASGVTPLTARNAPTLNDHVYGTLLTVSATT